MINSHVIDGVALTKFIYWIKKVNKKKITEVDAQIKLEKFRKKITNIYIQVLKQLQGLAKMVQLFIIELKKRVVEQ